MDTLVTTAQKKEYSKFSEEAKAILTQKVKAKLDEINYFEKLNRAQGVNEGENPFAKDSTKSDDDSEKDVEDETTDADNDDDGDDDNEDADTNSEVDSKKKPAFDIKDKKED